MNDKIIDVNYTEVNNSTNKNYYSIEDISSMLEVEEPKIIFWCNRFNDILKIQSIGQYQIFDDNDLNNLKTIKKLNIDNKMDVAAIKKYLKENNHVILSRQQNINETSIVSVLAKIINSQNRKINIITNSHDRILKSNQKIVENQEKFMQMLSKYHQELSIDRLDQKETLLTIKESQLKETENLGILNNKVEELSTDLKDENEKISSKVEDVKKHINESTEKSVQMQQENKQILEQVNTTISEMKKESDEIKELIRNMRKAEDKKGGFWDKLIGKHK